MEEENCHFVYKHLWSPMKAPCSPGWVSPRRGQGPGTQSIMQRRDFQTEGLEQWKVLLSVEGQFRVARQWSCVPAGENHLLPTGEIPPPPLFVVLFVVSKCVKVNTKHLWDTPEVLSQYFISLPVSVDKSESCCENMGVLVSSVAMCALPLFEKCFFIWASVEGTCQEQ